jgi:hypothetical protein
MWKERMLQAPAHAGTQGPADLGLTPESDLPSRPRVRRGRVRYAAFHLQRVQVLLATRAGTYPLARWQEDAERSLAKGALKWA